MKTYLLRPFVYIIAMGLGALLISSPALADSSTEPEARLKQASALTKDQKYAEALEQYVWCYDHGAETDAKFARTRDSRVTNQLASLGKDYPPARAVLVERRDALQKQVKEKPKAAGVAVLKQLANLDRALVDDAAILETLALFPVGKTSYKAYGSVVQDRLIETKHYREAVAVDAGEDPLGKLEQMVAQLKTMRASGRPLPEKAEAGLKKGAISALPAVEMYAGSGDLKRAKKVTDLLLSMYDTPEYRAQIAGRLRRGGAEELAAKYEPAKK